MRWFKVFLGLLAAVLLGLAGYAFRVARRALPVVDGTLQVAGLKDAVQVLRDRWGVPHIFATSDEDAAFALGFVHAQDRLFQMDLTRHASQGRLAEVFGERALRVDRLFRTVDLVGPARRMLAEARPEARAAAAAYARGVNAWLDRLDGRLPPEFVLAGHGFEPARDDDFVGILGYMTWGLNISWEFDPLYEKLVARVGPERASELFPFNAGGTPSVHAAAEPARLSLFRLTPEEEAWLAALPTLRASNNWVVGPGRSSSGRPILANDPHLGHALPGIWYEAHLSTPTLEVAGVTLPGFPSMVIGHNRRVAWGFTNVMQDAADFFVETLDEAGTKVLHRGQWVDLATRTETIAVKGGPPVALTVRATPHGPIVSDVMEGETRALSYRWTFAAATHASEVEGFHLLNRARDWTEFRAALRRFGAAAQNAVYADADGHIGLQTTGAFPRLRGQTEGTRLREGADGSEEWDGFVPFEEHPASFDPPEGFLASANNVTVPAPTPFYISSQWEPVDRIVRIREMLREKDRLSVADFKRMQADVTLVSARELAGPLVEAARPLAAEGSLYAEALSLLEGWDGVMRADAAAPSVFSTFYRRLFYAVFEDEMGPEVARGYRLKANLSAVMMRAVLERGPERWFDRVDTAPVEDRQVILRAAFRDAVDELSHRLGGRPAGWAWGRLHTLELVHPVGRASPLLARYFNRGPFPVPGHNSTVNKMEFDEADFRVRHGPSVRRITDFADLDAALSVLPGGQSGIPASPHYDDQTALWLAGEYHPLPMDRSRVEAMAEARLRLEPRR